MQYAFGFVIVTLDEAIVSLANIYDEALSRDVFRSVWSIMIINGILLICVLPIAYLILRPGLPSTNFIFLIAATAFIEVAYQLPYYLAMRHGDASVVVSLFGMEKILVPFSAYFIAHEHLSFVQYVRYGIIIIASILLSVDRKHLRLNKAFYLMIPVVILLALQTGLEKNILETVPWENYFFWMLAMSAPLYVALFLLSRHSRKEVLRFFRSPFNKKYLPVYGQNAASWVSQALGVYALALLPATIVSAFGSFQSLIVHVISAEEGKWLRVRSEVFSWRRMYLCGFIGLGMLLTVLA